MAMSPCSMRKKKTAARGTEGGSDSRPHSGAAESFPDAIHHHRHQDGLGVAGVSAGVTGPVAFAPAIWPMFEHFVDAQERVYPAVLAELEAGEKRTHWMWFIFPQLRGLGRSATAQHYGLQSLEEARTYLLHPLLGTRLRDCTRLVNAIGQRSAREIFGAPDDLKFRSSMTLFARAAPDEPLFRDALAKYYGGEEDR
jgi:uncharacterized protein (DUF1810 family)